MEYVKCLNCMSTDGDWDSRTLTFYCRSCRKESHYTRKDINVDFQDKSERAIQSFCDKHYDIAEKIATEIIEISYYHAPANYILSYVAEIVNHKFSRLDAFFTEMEKQDEIEESEIEGMEKMIISSPKRLVDYETRIINLIAKNTGSDSKKEQNLQEFTDTVCPYWISVRTSSTFLTSELAEIYREIAEHCSIPKTCYALYNAIVKIPDSPCVDNTFYLETKSRRFYENFVLPIGRIINSMKDEETRTKFSRAYENRRQQFEAKLK